jgi:hypothetical protein
MNKNPFCKCGCGQRVTKPTNKYIWGHNSVGRIATEEEREKQRQRMLGKTYEELYGEERAQQVKKKLWKNREKKDPPIKGMTWEEYYGEEKANEMRNNIREKNTNNPKLKDRHGEKNPYYKGAKDSLYSCWAPKLTFDEHRENEEGKIEVRCMYCNKWFIPTPIQMDNRIRAIRKETYGNSFYCSDNCKKSCPDFYQVLWPKNYKPYEGTPYKNRVEVTAELRKIVFERDNWECQKCGVIESLECHHIDPVSQEPFFANDPDSCITLCKECHKFIHTEINGCKYNELKGGC